ncbi:MAG: hypothetical protein P8175_05610 [Deltaproteobacteria bacterium]|jgi:hypothetical protein
MDRKTFEGEMIKARMMEEQGNRPDYWRGFQRGLRRRFHGEASRADKEHSLWMGLVDDRGRGYRDGFLDKGYDLRN